MEKRGGEKAGFIEREEIDMIGELGVLQILGENMGLVRRKVSEYLINTVT